MSNFIVPFFIFFKFVSNHQLKSSESVDNFDQENEKILAVIDDIFIAMKINENFKKSKNVAEYISIHNYIQGAVENRNKKYKEMYNLTKITLCHKTAYYVTNINKAIGEMISEHRVTNTELFFGNNKHFTFAASDDILTDFVSLAKLLRLNLNINKNSESVKDLIAKNVETRRIFAGTPAEIRNWPFVVSVHIAGKFTCAGSIVREDLVLSAGTCFKKFFKKKLKDEFKNNIWIRAGSDFYNSGGVMVRAVMLHFHKNFNLEERTNNMVVIQLKLKLRFKMELIEAVKFARTKTKYGRVHIVGWGNKEYEPESVPASPEFVRMTEQSPTDRRHYRRNMNDEKMIIENRQLQHSVLDRYKIIDCVSIYPHHNITSRNFCVGSMLKGSGACKFDLGGPGVIGSVLQGVVSFGPSRCGIEDAPTVFTKVYRYARWIDKLFCQIPLTNDTVDDSGQEDALMDFGPGGKKIRKYPFVASVFLKDKYVCTGAILRRELVITVAACLKPFDFMDKIYRRKITFNTNIHVRVGSDQYSSGTLIPVVNFHFHHNFDHNTLAFNLVILVLKDKINFSQGAIGGVHVSNATRLKLKYEDVNVVGWGADCPLDRTGRRNEPASRLRSVMLNRTSYRDCRKNYTLNNATDYNVSRLHHCLLPGNWGADSLGNLVILKKKLFGLVSVGCSRRTADSPVVFIKTGLFSWWLNRIMCRYKERFDPSDLSKISDYGSIENVSSAEMAIIIGPKIYCRDNTGHALNCTSINATTYYCESYKPLKHGTPITCKNLDPQTRVNCTEGNITEIDREDISRSVVNWPHGSTHNGSVYYCETEKRKTSNRECNQAYGGYRADPHTCYETNCTEIVDQNRDKHRMLLMLEEKYNMMGDPIIDCTIARCYVRTWWAVVDCTLIERYCQDIKRRTIDCPLSTTNCWPYWKRGDGKQICRFKHFRQRYIERFVPKRVTDCYYTVYCQYDDHRNMIINCPQTSQKKCVKIDNTYVCQDKPCKVLKRKLICQPPGPLYCVDRYQKPIVCENFVLTNCTTLKNYIYTVAIICTEEHCPIELLFAGTHKCEIKGYCYTILNGVKKTIDCPKPGKNCRYEEDMQICAVSSNCFTLDGVVANCIQTKRYCLDQEGFDVDCPPFSNLRHIETNVSALTARPNDDDDHDKNDDLELATYASPRQILTNITALRAWTDDDDDADDNLDKYDDLELTTYASPRQIQPNVPTVRARVDDDDDDADYDSDKDYDLQWTTYASPRQIQTNIPLRAQTDDGDDADANLAKYGDLELTTYYTSPRQIQPDIPALKSRADDDDVADDDPDLELTS